LSGEHTSDAIIIAVRIGDPVLADRVVAVLADVPGVHLVAPGEPADAALVSPENASIAVADAEVTAAPIDGERTSATSGSQLTPREREVLALLAEGASNKTIARRLGISVHTAKFHVGSLLDKLDATGRTDAVAHAARLGVIQL
jgi:DNA-binding CsgD family transcriptional regulator